MSAGCRSNEGRWNSLSPVGRSRISKVFRNLEGESTVSIDLSYGIQNIRTMTSPVARSLLWLVCALLCLNTVRAQLSFTGPTPDTSTGRPNTFINQAGQTYASSLLASGTPTLLYMIASVADVSEACSQFQKGGRSFPGSTFTSSNQGKSDKTDLTLTATGGCHATSDESGRESCASEICSSPRASSLFMICCRCRSVSCRNTDRFHYIRQQEDRNCVPTRSGIKR